LTILCSSFATVTYWFC